MANIYPSLEKNEQSSNRVNLASPGLYVLDVRAWLGEKKRNFALVSGSSIVVANLSPGRNDELQNTKSESIKSIFSLLKKANLSVSDIQEMEVSPWTQEEAKDEKNILTKNKRVYLFIGDCHIGTKNANDNFYKNGLEAANTLEHFLSVVKSNNVTAIQLGDFIDIWENETRDDVLYIGKPIIEQEVLTNCAHIDPTGRCEAGTKRERMEGKWRPDAGERVNEAIKAINTAWKSDQAKINTIINRFDWMIPGNHDMEAVLVAEALHYKKLKNCMRLRMGFQDCIMAEHGHYLDSSNNTINVTDIGDTFEKVKGKQITYVYA